MQGPVRHDQGQEGQPDARHVNSEVEVTVDGNLVKVAPRSGSNFANAMAGTTRAHIANMVTGVTKGFEKKLELVGVGYRAAVQGKKLNLTLGFLASRGVPDSGRASRSRRRARTRSS